MGHVNNHSNHQHGPDGTNRHHAHIPYWKCAHTDWRFWVGIFLMFLAMMVYVVTGDLAWRPGSQPHRLPPISDGFGK